MPYRIESYEELVSLIDTVDDELVFRLLENRAPYLIHESSLSDFSNVDIEYEFYDRFPERDFRGLIRAIQHRKSIGLDYSEELEELLALDV